MTNDHDRLTELYNKYVSKEITGEQRLEFLTYVRNSAYTEFIEELISGSYEHPEVLNSLSTDARERIFQTIVGKHKIKTPKLVRLWPRIAVAVALVTVISGALLFYYPRINQQHSNQLVYTNDVAPGISGATLTLSNGKKIRLSDAQNGEVAKEAGVMITKSESGEVVYEGKGDSDEPGKLNTLSTANGETYKLRLPDGSYVWLNSASSLTYSSRLVENGKRTVKLQGEGYFEIAKDKSHPFVVATDKQNVEVLGTHFNINSYPNETMVSTTLIEGSVSVIAGNLRQVIKPGEQAVNNGNSIKVNEVNTENVIDWKNGDFNLDELDFRVAMRKIARWYNVDVIYEASVPENIKSGGWISRKRSLSAVLRLIESSGQLHFKVEGRKVYVAK
ncbi:FecR family protein [Chitinophaga sp. CF118]|uniref:FecR family protein n=1 Tax=Chitinophaga sp. CF118 TaxID=1884367 RepID=UPI0008F40DD0|nr:FecR family protein [Chitinophaga sp. CF118]SFE60142.1 FecR family protein [Chitinophaga sp. CF118]